MEGGAFVGCSFGPGCSGVAGDVALHNHHADAGAGKFDLGEVGLAAVGAGPFCLTLRGLRVNFEALSWLC
jgi:hypothetical protein